jgi:hypothetical protein
MFKSNLATYPHASIGNTYGQNLGLAARAFLAALLAVKPAQPKMKTASRTLSNRAAMNSVKELYHLANRFGS